MPPPFFCFYALPDFLYSSFFLYPWLPIFKPSTSSFGCAFFRRTRCTKTSPTRRRLTRPGPWTSVARCRPTPSPNSSPCSRGFRPPPASQSSSSEWALLTAPTVSWRQEASVGATIRYRSVQCPQKQRRRDAAVSLQMYRKSRTCTRVQMRVQMKANRDRLIAWVIRE